MSVTVTQQLTQQTVTVTGNPVENNVTVTVSNARGASGAAGPNTITTSTTAPSLTGYIFGNGTTIAGATAAVSAATASTLVRRDSAGNASFGALDTSGLTVTGGTVFGEESLVQFDALEYYYGTGAASAHRIALGLATTDAVQFGNGTFATGSIATSQPLTLTQTWTNAATTYAGMRVNVTNTASNAASKLMDLQVGGVSKFTVSKGGTIFSKAAPGTNSGTAGADGLSLELFYEGYGMGSNSNGEVLFYQNNTARTRVGHGVAIASDKNLGFTNVAHVGVDAVVDTMILRDAANTLAQRNGTNAQVTRIYDTYASASDYHRLAIATARATATGMSSGNITLTNIIPAGAVVVGVTCKVTTAITGATSFDLGTAADQDRFGAGIAIALGTTSDNRNWTSGTVECFPYATSLILTANDSDFTGGAVYVSVQYLSGQAD